MVATPHTLYKYLPESRIDFFDRPKLRFTPITELNDPFESSFVYTSVENPESLAKEFANAVDGKNSILSMFWQLPVELRSKAAEELIKSDPDKADFIKSIIFDRNSLEAKIATEYLRFPENKEAIQSTLAGMLSSPIFRGATSATMRFIDHGILSLSQDPQNILMWSHYASNHKGLVVGLNTQNAMLFEKVSSLYGMPRQIKKVTYSPNRPTGGLVMDANSLQRTHEINWYTKNECWGYEQEWRILETQVSKMPRCGTSHVVGLELLQIAAIKSIHIGMRASNEMKSIATDFIKENPEILLYQSKMHKSEYKIEFDSIMISD